MYSKRVIVSFVISLFLFSLFIACKSSSSSDKKKKNDNNNNNNKNYDLVDNYSNIFMLLVQSVDGVEVVCGCYSGSTGSLNLNNLVSNHECKNRSTNTSSTEYSGVFIEKTRFDSIEPFKNYLTQDITVVGTDEFKALITPFDEVISSENKGYYSIIGSGKQICYAMNSNACSNCKVHIVAVKGDSNSYNYTQNTNASKWEKYPTPNVNEQVWKDKVSGRLWTRGDDLNQKGLVDAMNYCDNLTYGGFKDWGLPTEDQMEEMHKRKKNIDDDPYVADSIIPEVSVVDVNGTKWWITQDPSKTKLDSMQYLKKDKDISGNNKDEFNLVSGSKLSDKLYVICVR